MIVLELLLFCLLFTGMVRIDVLGGAVNGLYFYPKPVQERAISLGLMSRETMQRKRKCFMLPLYDCHARLPPSDHWTLEWRK